MITILLFFPNENLQLKIFISLIFSIGFFSDLNTLKSPNLRFLIQFIVVLCFVYYSEYSIQSVRIEFLDKLFENNLIRVLFTSFCILILINGSNFIDGVNTLAIGYYLLVLIFISLVLNDFQIRQNNSNLLNILIFTLVLLFILNFFELLYLGDNGAYVLSFFVEFFYLKFQMKTFNFSILYYEFIVVSGL